MSKNSKGLYTVKLREVITYEFEVDALNETQAMAIIEEAYNEIPDELLSQALTKEGSFELEVADD